METSRKPRNIKLHNEKLVIRILGEKDALPASEIAARANLSITSVMKILVALQEAHAVKSIGKGSSTEEGGKRPELFAINEEYLYSVGCMLTEANMQLTLMDFRKNTVGTFEKVFESALDAESAMNALCEEIRNLVSGHNLKPEHICGIAVGINGIIDADNGILRHPILDVPWEKNTPFGEMLNGKLSEFKNIRVDNTGRYMAYSLLPAHPEYMDKTVFYIFAGSHTVGCLLQDGEMQRGYNGFLGEVGHMTILPEYRKIRCSCGSYGCFESLVREDNIREMVAEALKEFPQDEIARQYLAGQADMKDLFEAAETGSELCHQIVRRIARYFSLLVRNIMLSCDPQIIVLSGTYARAGEGFRKALQEEMSSVPFFKIDSNAELNFVDEETSRSASFGAAYYALERYLRHTEEL